jgi:hypothetical protein
LSHVVPCLLNKENNAKGIPKNENNDAAGSIQLSANEIKANKIETTPATDASGDMIFSNIAKINFLLFQCKVTRNK